MVLPVSSFTGNPQNLASIDGIARSEMEDAAGDVVASIASQPGKQGSLAAFQYLCARCGDLTAEAVIPGLAVFAKHTEDARDSPAGHLNID